MAPVQFGAAFAPIGPGGPYYVPQGELANPFASFVSNYLMQRNPRANQVFTARLRALDPRARAAEQVALEKVRADLLKQQEMSARALREEALKRELSGDEFAREAIRYNLGVYQANAGIAQANIGRDAELVKAGALSPKGREIVGELQARVAEAQRYGLETGDLDTAKGMIEEAVSNAATAAEGLSPGERTVGLPSAVQSITANQLWTDPADQADVRAIIEPALGRAANVEVGSYGAGRPKTAAELAEFARGLRGAGAAPAGVLTPPAAAQPPAPSGQAAPARGAGGPGGGSGGGGVLPPGPAAAPVGGPGESRPAPAPSVMPDAGGGGVSATEVRTRTSGSTPEASARIQAGVERLDRISDERAAAAEADPFGGLGGFRSAVPRSPDELVEWIRRHPRQAARAGGLDPGRPRVTSPRGPGRGGGDRERGGGDRDRRPAREGSRRQARERLAENAAELAASAAAGAAGLPGNQGTSGPGQVTPAPPKRRGSGKTKPKGSVDVDATIREALPEQSDTTVDEFGMPLESDPDDEFGLGAQSSQAKAEAIAGKLRPSYQPSHTGPVKPSHTGPHKAPLQPSYQPGFDISKGGIYAGTLIAPDTGQRESQRHYDQRMATKAAKGAAEDIRAASADAANESNRQTAEAQLPGQSRQVPAWKQEPGGPASEPEAHRADRGAVRAAMTEPGGPASEGGAPPAAARRDRAAVEAAMEEPGGPAADARPTSPAELEAWLKRRRTAGG